VKWENFLWASFLFPGAQYDYDFKIFWGGIFLFPSAQFDEKFVKEFVLFLRAQFD
jgi:hypothetical protein